MKNQTHLFSIGEAASMCGVCVGTIRRWCRSGKLHETFRTFGNQRRFSFEDLKNIISPHTDNRITVGYARVSSYDQKSDLDAQIKRLSDYGCQLVIHDLGSGFINPEEVTQCPRIYPGHLPIFNGSNYPFCSNAFLIFSTSFSACSAASFSCLSLS